MRNKISRRNIFIAFIAVSVPILSVLIGILGNIITQTVEVDLPLSRLAFVFGLIVLLFVGVSAYLFIRDWNGNAATALDTELPISTSAKIISNLPSRVQFVGREKDKARVLDGLRTTNHPLIVIQGPAGIGKTALAKEVGWIIKNKTLEVADLPNYEGVIWIEDHNGELGLSELLDFIGDVLGHSRLRQMSLADKSLEAVKLLHDRSCFIIVDNFETITDQQVVEFLKTIPSPISRALVTFRGKAWPHGDSWIVTLVDLVKEDRLALIQSEDNRLPPDSRMDQRQTQMKLKELCDFVEGDPYSIGIRVGQIRAGVPLENVLGTMNNKDSTDDERLEPSWETITGFPESQVVLMSVALFQSAPSQADVETVSEVRGDDLSAALKRLDELCLVETSTFENVNYFRLHSRTKAFVERKLAKDQPIDETLRRRMAEWVEQFVKTYGGTKNWIGYPKLDQEYRTVLSTVQWCSGNTNVAEKRRAIAIWRAIDHYLSVRNNLVDYYVLGERILSCAEATNDTETQVDVKVAVLGYVLISEYNRQALNGEFQPDLLDKAERLVSEGLMAYQENGDWAGVGTANRYLGMIAQLRGDLMLAKQYFEASLSNFELIPGWDNLGAVLGSLGILSLQQDDPQSAIEYHSRRLSLAEAISNPESMAVALYNLGRVADITNQNDQARDYYDRSLEHAHRASRNDIIASSQYRLADQIVRDRGDLKVARIMVRNANEYYEKTGDVPEGMIELVRKLDGPTKTPTNLLYRLSSGLRDLRSKH